MPATAVVSLVRMRMPSAPRRLFCLALALGLAADMPAEAGPPRTRAPIVLRCPGEIAATQGIALRTSLQAREADSLVNSASMASGAPAGIGLSGFVPAGTPGGLASVSLDLAATLAPGHYPLVVRFASGAQQQAACMIDVQVQASAVPLTPIYAIQGKGNSSPLLHTAVSTVGILTLKVANGFYLQDEVGDGDPATSDGIFVYTGASPVNAQTGDQVQVSATVAEFGAAGAPASLTELDFVSALTVLSAGHHIDPLPLQLPNAQLERAEGMLVRFSKPLSVAESAYLGTRGELTLSAGRLEAPTNRYRPRSSQAQALMASNAINQIVLDDGIFVPPTKIPYLGKEATIRVGDTVDGLTGVIDFGVVGGGGSAYKLQPTRAPAFARSDPRPQAPTRMAGTLTIASANLMNFFTTFTDGNDAYGHSGQGCTVGASTRAANCRGASDLQEFVRQRDKVVAELAGVDADLFGLMEVQNDGDTTVAYLVDSLNAKLGAPVYAYVPRPPATGTDAIRVAIIYKPAVLALVGPALSDDGPVHNRAPMAQTFQTAGGLRFSLVVNHFKAKSGCPKAGGADADQGDGQGCWVATRVLQAQRLTRVFLPAVQAAAHEARMLVVGDLNALAFDDPVKVLTDTGLVNEVERYVRPRGLPYSFVFDNQSGYLDHALASPSLDAAVVDVREWHINAAEPAVIDYHLAGKPQDEYAPTPFRASDHDPLVLHLRLQPRRAQAQACVAAAKRAPPAGLRCPAKSSPGA